MSIITSTNSATNTSASPTLSSTINYTDFPLKNQTAILQLIAEYAQGTIVRINANASLPVVMIFERHWDKTPKLVLQHLLPLLAKQGYRTVCFETPENSSASQIIETHKLAIKDDVELQAQAETFLERARTMQRAPIPTNLNLPELDFETLDRLLHQWFSTQKHAEFAQRIKHLPASQLVQQILNQLKGLSMSVKGVDISGEAYADLHTFDIGTAAKSIRANEEFRTATFVKNLFKMQADGTVFLCGWSHAGGITAAFQEGQMVRYFLRSPGLYCKDEDQIFASSEYEAANAALKDRKHILTEAETAPFAQRIAEEAANKTDYVEEIVEGSSHTQHLTSLFNTPFRAFLRPSYHVDALVSIDDSPHIGNIRKRFLKAGIAARDLCFEDGRRFLAVAAVNTTEAAYKIRKLTD